MAKLSANLNIRTHSNGAQTSIEFDNGLILADGKFPRNKFTDKLDSFLKVRPEQKKTNRKYGKKYK